MAKFLKLSCIFLAFAFVLVNATDHHPHPPSPAPAPPSTPLLEPPSCVTLIYKMVDCLPYLADKSKVSEPDDSCCSGVMEVWKLDSHCVCEALKSSADLGLQLNMTRVVHFPCACGFKHLSLAKCSLNRSRASSPIQSAKTSPTKPPTQPVNTSDAAFYSHSNFFPILISFVMFLIF